MSRRLPWAFVLLLLATGCASEGSASDASGAPFPSPPSMFGGQTGALLPGPEEGSCGPRVGPDQVLTLSAVDPGFVASGAVLALAGSNMGAPPAPDVELEDGGLDGTTDAGRPDAGTVRSDAGLPASSDELVASDWQVRSSSGETIALIAEQVGDSVVLRPAADLAPGTYTLVYLCGERATSTTVEVLEQRPAPGAVPGLVSTVSLAYDPSAYYCSEILRRATLLVGLSSQRQTLVDTTQLSLRGDGVDLVIAPFATLDASESQVRIGVPICESGVTENCLPARAVSLELVSETLDDPNPGSRIPVNIDASCIEGARPTGASAAEPEPAAPAEEPKGCSVHRGKAGNHALSLMLLGVLAFSRRRRRSAVA